MRNSAATMRSFMLGAIALSLLSSGSAFEANSDIALDLQAGACTAFEVDNLPHKYSYDVDLVAMIGICGPQNIRSALRQTHGASLMGPRISAPIIRTCIR